MNSNLQMSMVILLTGLLIVFLVLVLLIFVVKFYSKVILSLSSKKNNEDEYKKMQEVQSVESIKKIKNEKKIDETLIAVISGAVHYILAPEGKKYQIKEVKRTTSRRSEWLKVGLIENMSPFFKRGR